MFTNRATVQVDLELEGVPGRPPHLLLHQNSFFSELDL